MPNGYGGTELLNPANIISRLNLGPGQKVGDLGCGGAAHFTIPTAKIVGYEGMVYAVDILKSVLVSVESRAKLVGVDKQVKTVWSNLEVYGATKIPDESLDAVLLMTVLFQTKKHKEVIKEALRLLKMGGKILIVDWRPTGAHFGPPLEIRVSLEQIKEIIKEFNLEILEEFEAGKYHWGMIFKKI